MWHVCDDGTKKVQNWLHPLADDSDVEEDDDDDINSLKYIWYLD